MIQYLIIFITLLTLCSGCRRRPVNSPLTPTTATPVDRSGTSQDRPFEATYIALSPSPHGTTPQPAQNAPLPDITDREVPRVPVAASSPFEADVVLAPAPTTDAPKSPLVEERLVKIDFTDEELGSLLQHFASLQHYNIILPQGADALTQKITFKLPHEIPLKAVNQYLDFFLELSGYSRIPHGTNLFRVVKKNDSTGNVARESLPLYIGLEPDALPSSDTRIRVIHYFKNLRVPETAQGTDPMTMILNDVLSSSRLYLYDSRSNAAIISDKSINIKAALTLLNNLDSIGTKDIVRAIPLYNTYAETIAQLLTTQILAANGGDDTQGNRDAGRYFASGLRVQADERTNTLFVMGREPAVERLQSFVRDYIDVPSDSGNSMLHLYSLQYLDAEKFAPILQKIVSEQAIGSSGQAKQGGITGPYRFFEGVTVVAEKVIAERVEDKKLSGGSGTESILKGTVYRGGNRILVTATTADWARIERIIKTLDKPRLQIILQTMIVDFDINNNKILSAQTRNPSWMQLPPGVSFQAAHLANPILTGEPTANPNPPPTVTYLDPTTLAADLLRLITGGPPPASAAGLLINNTAANVGSTILSFNDTSPATPGIWSFLQWLDQFGAVKVLSNPHIIVLNNNRGEELISDIQRFAGPGEAGQGGAIAIKQVDVPAALKISVVPRASSVDRLSLQVSITIQQFVGNQGARSTREIHTNVNLSNGETLVIGGLTRYNETDQILETPILGKVPILRWLFSKTSKSIQKTNLVVFISPTIIEPRIRDGINAFTKDTIERNYDLLRNDAFAGQLKEPVSYLFFSNQVNTMTDTFDEYLAEGTGEFVFTRQGAQGRPTNHHCEPIEELKEQLADEENPLFSTQKIPK